MNRIWEHVKYSISEYKIVAPNETKTPAGGKITEGKWVWLLYSRDYPYSNIIRDLWI